jgi:hypothetical protein
MVGETGGKSKGDVPPYDRALRLPPPASDYAGATASPSHNAAYPRQILSQYHASVTVC